MWQEYQITHQDPIKKFKSLLGCICNELNIKLWLSYVISVTLSRNMNVLYRYENILFLLFEKMESNEQMVDFRMK